MGKPVIGDVVVIPFRQTDLQVGKRRRALVVADLKGRRLNSMPDNFASHQDSYSVELMGGDFRARSFAHQ